ncbi:acyltransferase domain-containing protein [uncultured Friedmanniella sp.]|uniref:acyltransferase domain-containing protein n=1 Tax=uncultured Friedmanniella sp. TaxID=335381 RepID=UPI0035CB8FFF
MPATDDLLLGLELPGWLDRLGLRPDDRSDLEAVLVQVRDAPDQLAVVDRLATALRGVVGRFPGEPDRDLWPDFDVSADPYGVGVLPLLALVATAPDLVAFHRSRGVPEEVSAQTLTELGQQVWVHRQTYGSFGLHTYWWVPVAWSGSLYWLGRLQFNLELLPTGWVVSTHIPQSGRLDAAAVDDSFARAATFFPRHFPERPATDFWCHSWLLDPALAQALDPASNMARFQRRWHLYGDPMPGDEDALFFTFARRGEVDLDTLPQRTSLQRVIVQRLQAGEHWSVWAGLIPMSEAGPERLRA